MRVIRTLYISKVKKQWKVHWENENSGMLYTLRSLAISSAKKIIANFPRGDCFQLQVQNANGRYVTEWRYGIDPFPLKKDNINLAKKVFKKVKILKLILALYAGACFL
jgi:hypothetical protein